MKLPKYLNNIRRVIIDASVEKTPIAQRVQERLPHILPERLGIGQHLEPGLLRGDILYLKEYLGKFVRACPGTSNYRCCGYRILHIGENCPLRCSYCILQAYFQDRVLKVWANQEALWAELDKTFGTHRTRTFRVGTGEFTDSLVLEPLTGYSRDLVEFLSAYPNVCLELKSKVVDLSWMSAVRDPRRVLPAWSMNASSVVRKEEQGDCSNLEERLQAAQECAMVGFRVCLHFDPLIYFPGWEKEYTQTVEMIFDFLQPEQIAYVSLGSFRHMPDLKKAIQKNFPDSTYIYEEFITGKDGKQRLLRPLRVTQFRFLVAALRAKGLDQQLYLCMESDEVWKATFGYTPQTLGGLGPHLMRQAFL